MKFNRSRRRTGADPEASSVSSRIRSSKLIHMVQQEHALKKVHHLDVYRGAAEVMSRTLPAVL